MNRASIFVAGATVGVCTTLLATLLLRSPTDSPKTLASLVVEQSTSVATTPQPESQQPQRRVVVSIPSPSAIDVMEPTMANDTPSTALEDQWQTLVSGALEYEVAHRWGRRLEPEAQQRLLDKLSQLRYASQTLQEPVDASDSASLQAQLAHTFAILQVERAFRQELGIGVAEFIQGLDSEAIEDVAPPRTQP